ncbi:ABC transporter permease [Arthrobacter bambusae]|uniref:ABC transporter permease n=1 Tax=Arthrobacter bambusae TaxID=1338426 RepID=UPI00277FFCAB|nr:ABC transporter permease [Arthrobacter bambusae]MDQ0031320.1 NitT/TauT family transport system permease protein [Arthrobacter bambusae]MDQ0099543.1 NitT/TauT family transport system permease protein [Arthrobacter bambusae]
MPIEQDTLPAGEHAAEQTSESRHITSPSLKGNPDELRDLEAGLDKLQSDAHRKAHIDWTRIILPIAALLVLVLAWQFYVSLGLKRQDQVPGPLDVLGQFGELWSEGKAQEAILTSLQRGVIGFLISVVVATPIGLILAQVQPLRRAFGPLISGLQVLPSVAWVPAAIIWFGLSDGTVYFVVLMGAIPSIINGLISGVDQIPPQFRSVGKVLGASRLQMALQIVLPAALPGYLGGLKQGWAFSWRSLMAAEIIAVGGTIGFGLGSLLDQGRTLSDMATVMSAILAILFVGILIELLVFAPIERRLLLRRGLLAGSTR